MNKKFLVDIFLVICLVVYIGRAFTSAAAVAPATTPLEAIAKSVVNLLVDNKFKEVAQYFDDTMAKVLPADKLLVVWQQIIAQLGEYIKTIKTITAEYGEYKIVYVVCEFAKGELAIKLTFDKQAKIAGFFFMPPSAAGLTELETAYSPPKYANLSSFSEIACTIGDEEWMLPATLTLPKGKGKFPAVVLVHGSGPHDRDETVGACKPFKDLAWGLATKGIAVLRYEKRSRRYQDKFAKLLFKKFTVDDEVVQDALAAIDMLKNTPEVDRKRIFLLGHSLGGMLAPRIATISKALAGIIILAGNTRHLGDMALEQVKYLAMQDGKIDDKERENIEELERQIKKLKEPQTLTEDEIILGAPKSYWLDLDRYNPLETAKQLTCRILVLQGMRDYQVTTEDFNNWKAALKSRKNVTFKLYPELNHLFIAGKGKSMPEEYLKAGNVSEVVIKDIANWVKKKN